MFNFFLSCFPIRVEPICQVVCHVFHNSKNSSCCSCPPLLKSFVLHERRFILRLCSLCSAARCHLAAAHCHSLPLLAAAACCRCLLLLKSFVLHERRFVLRLWQDTRNLSITSKGVAIRHPRFASQCTRLLPKQNTISSTSPLPQIWFDPRGIFASKTSYSTQHAVCACIYNLRCVWMYL